MANPRFRFAVTIDGVTAETDIARFAQELEQLGYDMVMVGDHIPGQRVEPLAALAWVAASTTRLRIGTHVLALDFRNPVLLAKAAATLDQLSGGRLELGVGAGWWDRDYAMLGIPFDPPGERISRMVEALDILETYWRGEPFDHAGRFYTLTGVEPGPPPSQPGGPPIFIGGGGPRIMKIAGARAKVVGQNPRIRGGRISAEFFEHMKRQNVAQKIEWARDGAREAGRDPAELVFHSSVNYLWVCESTSEANEMIGRLAAATRLTEQEARELPTAIVGTPEMIRERIHRDHEELGFSEWSFSGGKVRGFGSVGMDMYRAFSERVMPIL